MKRIHFVCILMECLSDLFPSDLWLPKSAQHYISVLDLFATWPLALQPAQGIFCADTIPFGYSRHSLEE